MTVEDYHVGFEETNISFDLSDGDWFEDRYLFKNDEDRKNSQYYADKTRHEFIIRNTSDETQKAYAQVHAWPDRAYSFGDESCNF
jgi:hypothetical protein